VVISKYLKLGATIIISILVVDFVVFKLFVNNSVEQYEKMSQQHAKKVEMLQKNAVARAETHMQDQIQMQNKMRQKSLERDMFQPAKNNASVYNSYNTYDSNRAVTSQQRYYENKKKEQQRSLKREKAYKEQVILERQRKKDRENLHSLRAKNDETCDFWRKTYRQQATSSNKKNLKSACKRAAND